ncbi:DUF4234 domain-containing protein [Pseudomonas sp. S07E 245]|uniref:DUF4234 domain-containing protein n=1 Tax=Pseudomonas sp. S07E 245 TaxID=2866278 RepID=UPI001C734071|nr:DUF4234 domain-containing protein [Pseudomonas sp. S07E 245]QYX51484.1 DUF4234 domain-containing protein [Pseudomonas sp. S07E 245]
MTSPSELMNKVNRKTLHMVLLTMATGGLYLLLWLYKTNQHLREATGQEACSETYIIWMFVCTGLSGLFINDEQLALEIAAGLLSIAALVLQIVWAFNARRILLAFAHGNNQIHFRMNGFNTFVLNLYYINYCINELGETDQRQQPVYSQAMQP